MAPLACSSTTHLSNRAKSSTSSSSRISARRSRSSRSNRFRHRHDERRRSQPRALGRGRWGQELQPWIRVVADGAGQAKEPSHQTLWAAMGNAGVGRTQRRVLDGRPSCICRLDRTRAIGPRSDHRLRWRYERGERYGKRHVVRDLRAALTTAGLTNTQIVAPDAYDTWAIGPALNSTPAYFASVDILGTHYPCGHPAGMNCALDR